MVKTDRSKAPMLTVCILHVQRLACLKKCVEAVQKYTPIPYEIKILQQGPSDDETKAYLTKLKRENAADVVYSPTNLGCGGGRKVLVDLATTPLIMTIDDDIFLTEGWLNPILEILENHNIDAVGIPQFSKNGKLRTLSGSNIVIDPESRIVKRNPLSESLIESGKLFVEVNDVAGGTMIFRREMKEAFTWDGRYRTGFDDLDKSVQIILHGKWKQAVCLRSKVVHDDSCAANSEYTKLRYDYREFAKSYQKFREKWNLKLPLKDHLFYKYICLFMNVRLAELLSRVARAIKFSGKDD